MPKSEHLQLVDNVRPSRRRRIPTPTPGAPRPPTHLSREAKAEWKRVVPLLVAAGMVAKVDRAMLSLWCETWADWVEAKRLLRRDGFIVEGQRSMVKNPAFQIKRDCAQLLSTLSKDLVLSYVARARLAIPAMPDLTSDDDGGAERIEDVLA